jgi:hypothetical protein
MKSREIVYTIIISAIVTTVILALVFGVPMLQQSYRDAEIEKQKEEQRKSMYEELYKGMYNLNIKSDGVTVYNDATLTEEAREWWDFIDHVGEIPVRTVWIKNSLTVPAKLSLATSEPLSDGIQLTWNYSNTVLQSGEIEIVDLYLRNMNPDSSGINCDIIIKATA